jgi:hypothetical protein
MRVLARSLTILSLVGVLLVQLAGLAAAAQPSQGRVSRRSGMRRNWPVRCRTCTAACGSMGAM